MPPSSVYKGGEEGAGQEEEACPRGVAIFGLLLFLFGEGVGRERKEGGRKEGADPPPNSDWAWGGAPSLGPFPSFPLKPIKAHIPPGGFR